MSSLRKALFYRIDGVMLLLYVMLVAIGIAAVYSVEHRVTDVTFFMMNKSHMKQLVWFGWSLVIGFIILLTDSKFFSSFAFLIYTACLAVLVITIFAGVDVKGSRSWLGVGSFRFQPGEVAKIFTAMALAKFISLPETNFKTLKDRLIAIAIAMVPAVLILAQKETGLALVYFCFFLVMYREGLPNAILVVGFSMVGVGADDLADRAETPVCGAYSFGYTYSIADAANPQTQAAAPLHTHWRVGVLYRFLSVCSSFCIQTCAAKTPDRPYLLNPGQRST